MSNLISVTGLVVGGPDCARTSPLSLAPLKQLHDLGMALQMGDID